MPPTPSPSSCGPAPLGNEVWTLGARFARDLVARLGLPPEAVATLEQVEVWSRKSMIGLDELCAVMARSESLVQGLELRELRILEAVRALVPGLERAIRALATPERILRFVVEGLSPIVLPSWDVTLTALDPGHWRIVQRPLPGAAPCPALARASVGALRGLTALIDCAPLLVSADFLADRTIYDVFAHADDALPVGGSVTLEMVLGHDPSGQPLTTSLSVAGEDDAAARLRVARQRWSLTPRLEAVLTRVAHGEANKEIASGLGCAESTVEREVTQLLRRAGLKTRAQLVAAFWVDA